MYNPRPIAGRGFLLGKNKWQDQRKTHSNPQRWHIHREERIFSQKSLRREEKIASLQILRPEFFEFQ